MGKRCVPSSVVETRKTCTATCTWETQDSETRVCQTHVCIRPCNGTLSVKLNNNANVKFTVVVTTNQ